jgi:alcohol dehydrogenase class IV
LLDGTNRKLHHGTLNAMFLPAVIRFDAEADRNLRTTATGMCPRIFEF